MFKSLDGMYNQISEVEDALFQERKNLTLKVFPPPIFIHLTIFYLCTYIAN